MNKRDYEISIWEDINDSIDLNIGLPEQYTKFYFREQRKCVIGGSELDSPFKAFNIKLTPSIDGSVSLQFSIFTKCYNQDGIRQSNPYLPYLINEKKVKVKYGEILESPVNCEVLSSSNNVIKIQSSIGGDFYLAKKGYFAVFNKNGKKYQCEIIDCDESNIWISCETAILDNTVLKISILHDNWYDFKIKQVQENSKTNTNTYQCSSLFINELSKTGYNIIFDNELENNFGTVEELGATALNGTDWNIDYKKSESILQYIEEPAYEVNLLKDLYVENMFPYHDDASSRVIPAGSRILCFYSSLNNKEAKIQLVYSPQNIYEVDNEKVITNCDNYYFYASYEEAFDNANNLYYEVSASQDGTTQEDVVFLTKDIEISEDYRGDRLVLSPKSVFEKNSEKFVNIYEDTNGNEVYGYKDSLYITNELVTNLITNPADFTTTNGYSFNGNPDFVNYIYPEYSADSNTDLVDWINQDKTLYLKFKLSSIGYNSGIYDSRDIIDHFTKGEKYNIRLKYNYSNIGSLSNVLKVKIAKYNFTNDEYSIDENSVYFNFDSLTLNNLNGYYEQEVSCANTCLKADLKNIGIFIYSSESLSDYIFLEDFQLFKTAYDINDNKIYPDSLPVAEVKDLYVYYNLIEGKSGEDAINYLYSDIVDSADYTLVYDESYSKIGSISIEKSNHFNIIQTLAENFNCWVLTDVHHELNGEISLDSEKNQEKYIYFKNYITKDNFLGFNYGVNLDSIDRKLVSNNIVTKLIVENSENTASDNGLCSIMDANDNPSKENFILNFNYFINKGLISYAELLRDMYGTDYITKGYLVSLSSLNKEYDLNSDKINAIDLNMLHLNSSKTVAENMILSANNNIISSKDLLFRQCGFSYEQILNGEYNNLLKDEYARRYLTEIDLYKSELSKANSLLSSIIETIESEQLKLNNLNLRNSEILTEKSNLHKDFYQKYSQFIQEGTWTSNSYLDPNLYYFDAKNVLSNSAFPAVEYSIQVVDVSFEEDKKLYKFNVGDKTFISDEQFFGSELVNGVVTPKKVPVIIDKIEISLDGNNDKINVKNYKNNYKDIFQKITASTQSLSYSKGGYDRASGSITSNGQIKTSVIQDTILNNSLIISNAKNQSVKWDEFGISAYNENKTNEIVRIFSGGVFISTDGGVNWTSGITGSGINTNLLQAGQINVKDIIILNEDTPAFRWTSDGINAYKVGSSQQYDLKSFVRLDQFGIYGVSNSLVENFKPLNIADIQNNADFALTWDGFFLKTKGTNGFIKISSTEDIQVYQDISQNNSGLFIDRITLGRIGNELYGLRLKHQDGSTSLISNSEGDLDLSGIIKTQSSASPAFVKMGITYTDSTKSEIDNFFLANDGVIDTFKILGNGNVIVSGEINANSGHIGSFIIRDNGIQDENENIIIKPNEFILNAIDPLSSVKTEKFLFKNNNLSINAKVSISGDSEIIGKLSVGSINNINKIVMDGNNGSIYHSNYYNSNNNSGFLIDGTGKIYAKSIELGSYAYIKEYLKMENSYIFNPTYNNNEGNFILVKNSTSKLFSISNNGEVVATNLKIKSGTSTSTNNMIEGSLNVSGYLTVGTPVSIIINGQTGEISNKDYSENGITGWKISGEGNAIFNNVSIRGSIKSSTFEYQNYQSLGGSILVRPSSSIKSIQYIENYLYNLTLENVQDFNISDYCCIVLNQNKYYGVITAKNAKIITLNLSESLGPNLSIYQNTSIINFGQEGSIGLSINSSNNDSFSNAQSITIFSHNNDNHTFDSKIILGLMPNLEIIPSNIRGTYGLYADNVFLKGEMVSSAIIDNITYTSGINTSNNEVIWAGAPSDDRSNASFKVFRDGSLYASKGIFSGIVQNSILKTAKIIGSDGLSIYGNSSINFYSGQVDIDDNNNITGQNSLSLIINSDGLVGENSNLNFYKTINNEIVNILKTNIQSEDVVINKLKIGQNDKILIYEDNNELRIEYSNNYIALNENYLYSEHIKADESTIINKVILGSDNIYMLNIKNSNNKNIGFDIYLL